MQCSSDRTRFPLVAVAEVNLEVHLLPIAKVQFERFLAEPGGWGDQWYEEVRRIAPRASWPSFDLSERERLFMCGVQPDEALAFATWLGDGFDLPSSTEWRAVYRALRRLPLPDIDPTGWAPAARVTVERIREELAPSTLGELCLLGRNAGLVEWARSGEGFAGLGSPRREVLANLWDPLRDASVLHPAPRLPYVGFRLVRRTA